MEVSSYDLFSPLDNSPLFHNLLVNREGFHCRQHLVYRHLFTENLENTNQVEVTLTQGPPDEDKFINRLNIFKNRGWVCEVVFLFFTTEWNFGDSDILTKLIKLHTREYFVEGDNFMEGDGFMVEGPGMRPTLERYPDSIYVFLFPSTPKHQFSRTSVNLYNTKIPLFGIIFPPPAGPLNTSELCFHLQPMMEPRLKYFKCFADLRIEDYFLSDESQFAPDLDQFWINLSPQNVDYDFFANFIKRRNKTILHYKWCAPCPQAAFMSQQSPTNFVSGPNEYLIWVMTSFDGLTFLSCYTEPRLEFAVFLSPFDSKVWAGIGLSILAVTVLIDAHFRYYLRIMNYSSLLFFFALFLEDMTSLPERVLKSVPFKQVVVPCLLIGTLLTNCYTGMVITKLNSPLPAKQFDTFKDIMCLRSDNDMVITEDDFTDFINRWDPFAPNGDYVYDTKVTVYPPNYFECFSLLSAVNSVVLQKYSAFNPKFYQLFSVAATPWFDDIPQRTKKIAFLLHNLKSRWFPENLRDPRDDPEKVGQYIEQELVTCGRSAYIGSSSEVGAYHEHLAELHPTIQLYKSKQHVLEYWVGWLFRACSKMSKIKRDFERILESGIYKKRKEYNVTGEWVKRKKFVISKTRNDASIKDKVKPLSLQSTVQAVFVLGSSGIGIGLGLFFSEYW
ncbi:hypothetical protein Fcan01_00744 [Folsomia candida]|uniref:Uncharacterized protein n=1 Tax=Folsomia candida TaxID=158441 RepID=A0A226EZY7_FOLCA|nr:hypothetical protein Fcan01_00744 [Folsomia candida]